MSALVVCIPIAALVYGISAGDRLVSVLACVFLLALVLRSLHREGVRADSTSRQ